MRKTKRFIGFLCLVAVLVFIGTLFADKGALRQNMIRLHVVAASDAPEDQAVKLQVKDAVSAFLEAGLAGMEDIHQVKAYIQTQLPKIRETANEKLRQLGVDQEAVVTFLEEAFPTRKYDTFTLPAGIYDSLRITIGPGEGENWWCVVFPALCSQLTVDAVEDTAAGAGFSGPLAGTLTGKESYRVRFFFLEVLGEIEIFFYGN